jgi:hypothetical protein
MVLHLGRPRPCPQILDKVGKLARDKHYSLLRKSVNDGRNKFYYRIGLRLHQNPVYVASNASLLYTRIWSVVHSNALAYLATQKCFIILFPILSTFYGRNYATSDIFLYNSD